MLTYNQISSNKRKTAILIAIFVVLIAALGYLFQMTYSNPTILTIAVLFSLTSAYVSYYYSDKIALKISKATLLDPAINPQLYALVQRISAEAKIPTPKVYTINDSAPNAFATGRDPEHASVAFTTGILEKLSPDELEGVVAHEISHIRNFDIRLSTVVAILVGILTLISDWFLTYTFWGSKNEDSSDSQFQKLFFIIGLVLAIISPIIAVIIQLAISRRREYIADASGAELTKNPNGLANALEKIHANQQPMLGANKATAHMYISNPLTFRSGKSKVWMANLFNTHPPAEDRVQKLRSMIV
jgi:heat shock protein HtpX